MKADYDTDGTDGCLVTDLGGQHTDLDNEGSAGQDALIADYNVRSLDIDYGGITADYFLRQVDQDKLIVDLQENDDYSGPDIDCDGQQIVGVGYYQGCQGNDQADRRCSFLGEYCRRWRFF